MMDGNSADLNDPHQPSVNDPNLVNKLVEELKSQGIFDQIRSDCLAEVDTKVSTLVFQCTAGFDIWIYCSRHIRIFDKESNQRSPSI